MLTPPSASRTTPPPSGPPPVESSPVTRIAKYFVAHQRDEFEAFGYETIHQPQPFPSSTAFLNFLIFKTNAFRAPDKTPALSKDGFITAANEVAASIQKNHFPGKELLEFKYTGHKALLGHVTDMKCRPDITAAFSSDWNVKGVTHWSRAQLAGELASKGKTHRQQEHNAISYLHYLLLARPDLYVVQGLLIDESKITFLFGIGGCHIRKLDVPWDDKELYKLLYAFIYPLYDPDDFADKSYTHQDPFDPARRLHHLGLYQFCPISARHPFTTRTHVLSNASFEEKVNGKALTVLKDQLCRAGTRFDEETILKAIHGKGVVPGVVEAVHHETIQNRWSEVISKHRFGLRQFGLPFTSIPTPRKMLEVLFDVLEVLRYLHSESRVLHRDISAGNVLYIEDSSGNSRAKFEIAGAATATVSSQCPAAGHIPTDLPVFIKYLLRDSDDRQQTSILLIDFNRAELLNEKQPSKHQRMDRTGTPIFIARAVEDGNAVPLPDLALVSPIPQSPEVYASIHQKRNEKFPYEGDRILRKAERDPSLAPWKHELDHDAESVFWLFLYWAMVVQPANSDDFPEVIDPVAWASLLGQASSRDDLVGTIARRGVRPGLTHSIYKPLGPLIKNLASKG